MVKKGGGVTYRPPVLFLETLCVFFGRATGGPRRQLVGQHSSPRSPLPIDRTIPHQNERLGGGEHAAWWKRMAKSSRTAENHKPHNSTPVGVRRADILAPGMPVLLWRSLPDDRVVTLPCNAHPKPSHNSEGKAAPQIKNKLPKLNTRSQINAETGRFQF